MTAPVFEELVRFSFKGQVVRFTTVGIDLQDAGGSGWKALDPVGLTQLFGAPALRVLTVLANLTNQLEVLDPTGPSYANLFYAAIRTPAMKGLGFADIAN